MSRTDHDPMCVWGVYFGGQPHPGAPCIGDVAQVRANERERVHATIQAGQIPASLYEEMVHDAFADLRANVEARGSAAHVRYRNTGETYHEGAMDAYGNVLLMLIDRAGR
jgi:hypothetical protein